MNPLITRLSNARLEKQIMRKLLALDIADYEEPASYDLTMRAASMGKASVDGVLEVVGEALAAVVQLALSVYLIIDIDPWLLIFPAIPLLLNPLNLKIDRIYIDMMRKHSRVAPTEDVFIELEARQKPADSPDAVVESKAETERIRLALNRLPEAYREIIELRCLHELSAQRTGEILGISANSVNIKLSRARKALKDILDRENIEERTEAAQDDR